MQSQGHRGCQQRGLSSGSSVLVQSCGVNRSGPGGHGDIAATLGSLFNQNHENLT